jgi:hypothetical protein
MKKTVILSSLIKAKNDLELYIKIDQMKRLKKLFDPTFDIKDLNSQIDSKEDQLITIKEAIDIGNSTIVDGHTIHYYIYLLSKYNRRKSDLLTIQNRLSTDEFLSDNEAVKTSLLADIQELDALIEKDTDKKTKAAHMASKNKLKRSLSKVSLTSKSHTTDLVVQTKADIEATEAEIVQIKSILTKANAETEVEVDISDGFEIVVK